MRARLVATAFGASALALSFFAMACSALAGLDAARATVLFGVLLIVYAAGLVRRASRLQG